MHSKIIAIVTAVACFALGGCDSRPASSRDGHAHAAPPSHAAAHDGHDHDAHESAGHAHDLPARGPNGGVLLPLGDHLATLELALDPAAGRLKAYLLDCGAVEAIRSEQPTLRVRIDSEPGEPTVLELAPVANPLTGETIGDTSHFAGEHTALRGAARVRGQVERLEIRGQRVENVSFECGPAE